MQMDATITAFTSCRDRMLVGVIYLQGCSDTECKKMAVLCAKMMVV
jgi:hypothetical protein